MDHAMIGAPGRTAVEPTLVEAGAWPVLSDEPVSGVDRWVVLFERPQPAADDAGEPESTPNPPAAANAIAALDQPEPHLLDVIAAWRAADRELASLTEDDPDWNRVHAEVVGLRALHHRLFDARADHELASRDAMIARFADAAREWWQVRAPQPVPA